MSEKTHISSLEALILFYRGEGSTVSSSSSFHDRGYSLNDILETWGDEELEDIHDYIQWLFPLSEKSHFNPHGPILDFDRIELFRDDDRLQGNLIKAFKRMLSFYGLSCQEAVENITIGRTPDYPKKAQNWLTHYNHNYLRITRMLKSMRLLGCDRYARALFEILTQIYNENKDPIGTETYRYWQRAVGQENRRTRPRYPSPCPK